MAILPATRWFGVRRRGPARTIDLVEGVGVVGPGWEFGLVAGPALAAVEDLAARAGYAPHGFVDGVPVRSWRMNQSVSAPLAVPALVLAANWVGVGGLRRRRKGRGM